MNIKKPARLIALMALFTAIFMTGSGTPVSLAKSGTRPQTQESGPGWEQLPAPDNQWEDTFGYTAAMDGDFLVAGAPGMALPGEGDESSAAGRMAGAAYVYQRHGGTWSEGLKLMAADAAAGDQFGARVALSGDTLAVGAPYKWVSTGGNGAGAAYVFQRQGEAWTQQARLTAPDGAPFDLFGSALALQGDTLVVGARSADIPGGPNAGAVYIYQRQGEEWSPEARLEAEDATGRDYFGQDLALSGDTLLVAAPGHDESASGDNRGAVYRFRRRGEAWRLEGRLSAPDLGPNAQFGYALGLNDRTGTLAVYAQTEGSDTNLEPGMVEEFGPIENYLGSVYIFERRGADWRYRTRLTPDQRPYFAFYLRRVGRVASAGDASRETVVLSMGYSGTFLFQRQGDQWIELPPPEITTQASGLLSLPQLLAAHEEVLIFSSIGFEDGAASIVLVEMN